MLDERDDASGNQPLGKVGNVQINNVAVNKVVGSKGAKSAIKVILRQFQEQRLNFATPTRLTHNIQTLQKEIGPQEPLKPNYYRWALPLCLDV